MRAPTVGLEASGSYPLYTKISLAFYDYLVRIECVFPSFPSQTSWSIVCCKSFSTSELTHSFVFCFGVPLLATGTVASREAIPELLLVRMEVVSELLQDRNLKALRRMS